VYLFLVLFCCTEEPSAKQRRLDSNEDGSKGSADKNSSAEKESGEKVQSFPVIMMRIIKEDKSKATMWNKAGDTFCVLAKEFTDNLLEKYFPGTKFESFTRKLNRWGFRRVIDQQSVFPAGAHVYTHALFQRDKPDQLVNMTATRQRNDLATREQLLAEEQLASLVRQQQQQQLASTSGLPSVISHVGTGGAPLHSLLGNPTHASLLGGISQAAPDASLSDLLSIQQQLQQQQQGLSPSLHTAVAAQPLGIFNDSRLLDTLLLQQQRQAALSAGALSLNPLPPDPSLVALQRTAATTGLGLPSSSPLFGNLATDAGSLLFPSAYNNNNNNNLTIDQVARRQEERRKELLMRQLRLQQQQQQEDALRNILFRGSFR
jgi:hypothetical protein